MVGPLKPGTASGQSQEPQTTTRRTAIGLLLGAPLLSACAGVQQSLSQFSKFSLHAGRAGATAARRRQRPGQGRPDPAAVGVGQCRGRRAIDEERRRDGARGIPESEHPAPDQGRRRLASGAQAGAQQAVDEGAEIILGPLFALSVPAVAQVARTRGISVIAFSTDSSIAGRGVYLLSFLPESDVNRIVEYSASIGKKSFAALLPDNAYGNVVEAAFKTAVSRRGGRIVAFEKYGADRATPARNVAQALGQADALMIADDGDFVVATADALTAAGANLRNIQLLGTGLWDNPRVFGNPEPAGRPLRSAGPGRLSRLLRPLSHPLWRRAGAHRDARL